MAKFNGVKFTFIYHLKECEWRWRKETLELEKKTIKNIEKKRLNLLNQKQRNIDKRGSIFESLFERKLKIC